MKLALVLSLFMTSTAFAAPLHLDLEMTSEEYDKLLKTIKSDNFKVIEDATIKNSILLGQRLSKWIATINESRTADNAIRLTSPTTRRGIPIDQPSIYSPKTIKRDSDILFKELPFEMKDVILGSGNLPSNITIDDETFILFARRLDKIYQSAARFKGVDRFRDSYKKAASKDVRGYYYFLTNKIGAEELSDLAKIPEENKAEIMKSLILICLNADKKFRVCEKEVKQSFLGNQLGTVFTKYNPVAKKNWDSFFYIPTYAKRFDINWSNTESAIPFKTPKIEKFIPYLRNNIEQEWKWKGWQLRLVFGNVDNAAYLRFESGVVPHVNGLGGNEIVMDSNQPIEEYESQWTIRHEFGHVLGFPDCYHEFYDENIEAYVNYQLDITDLMCSRAGNMNERLFLEMKRSYDQ